MCQQPVRSIGSAFITVATLALAAPACTGTIGGSGDDPGGSPSNDPGNPGSNPGSPGVGGNGGTDPSNPGADPGAVCTDGAPAAVPMRRLSHGEYWASLRDLFPADVQPGQPALVADPIKSGFLNKTASLNVSPMLADQYKSAAEATSIKVAGKLDLVAGCRETDPNCADTFIASFGLRALRRPLDSEEKAAYLAFFNAEKAATSFAGAVQQTVAAMLLSPQFLYRVETRDGAGALTSYEVAARMSYLLWGSMPDAALLDAARQNQLADAGQRETQARRMLADGRARTMMSEFHREWFDLDRLKTEPKDTTVYPDWNPALQAAILEESNRFVEKVMVDGDARIETLFTSRDAMVNAPLAKLYGVSAPGATATDWVPVQLDGTQRAGVFTRAAFLAGRAHMVQGSPPLRAVLVRDHALCTPPLPPPPANADLTEPAKTADPAKGLTNRQMFEARVASDAACKACHSFIDALGFGFEHYDALGKYRTVDNGQRVDATGEITGPGIATDLAGAFDGAVELSQKMAASDQVKTCAVRNWYEFTWGRPAVDADGCRIEALGRALAAASGDVRELLVTMVKNGDFVDRR